MHEWFMFQFSDAPYHLWVYRGRPALLFPTSRTPYGKEEFATAYGFLQLPMGL
jgi:hypothetical protein